MLRMGDMLSLISVDSLCKLWSEYDGSEMIVTLRVLYQAVSVTFEQADNRVLADIERLILRGVKSENVILKLSPDLTSGRVEDGDVAKILPVIIIPAAKDGNFSLVEWYECNMIAG